MAGMSTGAYAAAYEQSIADPDAFWGQAATAIEWITPPTTVLDASNPPFYRWFPGATMNTCWNALDRHVRDGRGEQLALIYDSPVTGTTALLADVAKFAGVLAGLGVEKGDRVLIYLPMVPEAVIAMLACARLGAIHSVVFGGFAPAELAARIEDAKPSVIVSASCGIEPNRTIAYKPMLDAALERSEHTPESLIIVQRPQLTCAIGERDTDWEEMDWADLMRDAEPADCVEVMATDPLYILYTSGTTGRPKGIVRDNGGHAVALRWSMENIYDVQPGETWFTASDVGWVVGHSYIVYAPLLTGATTILYEGKPVGTPDAGAFWRIVSDYGAVAMFTAPTAYRAIKREDPEGRLLAGADISPLRNVFLPGERLDPDTYHWADDLLHCAIVDNWWQTETGWPIAANLRGLEPMPIRAGSPSMRVPGYDVQVLDEYGQLLPAGQEGAIAIKLPLPPGTLPTLWQDDERYVSGYLSVYDGYYLTGDGGLIDADGYVYVMGRTDDVLNVAGHRLSTGSIEAALAGHAAVAECAVIGVQDDFKGQIPRGLVVLKGGYDAATDGERIVRELVQRVRDEVGAVASLRQVDIVTGLPKTRSGKILRKTMREIADGKVPTIPGTIEDASVLDALADTLRATRH